MPKLRNYSQSINFLNHAEDLIPGGVNSPVRAFKGVGGTPVFIERGEGAYLFDVDGNKYLDFVGSWGPLILGHCHPVVIEAVTKALHQGASFGAPTSSEIELAKLISELVPAIEMVRLVSSGTEATMSAIRLARGFTKRDQIIKFNGCYHGHADTLLVEAGSGIATCGISGSLGVPQAFAEMTASIEFNDLDLFTKTVQKIGPEKIAAVIVEPVPGNMGLVLPKSNFLKGLREECDRHGIVLIFDEVMSGFRVGLGGATEKYGVTPDLITLGKVIGGGLPVGAFGGRREIMKMLAPVGPVYQAGTLSGNPLAVAAGIATLSELKRLQPYAGLEELAKFWAEGVTKAAQENDLPFVASYCGSMLGFFFSNSPVQNYSQAKLCSVELFKKFFHSMLNKGFYLAPSAYEAGFLSTAHTREDLEETIQAFSESFKELVEGPA